MTSPATSGTQKSLQSGGARLPPGHNQANAPDQPQPTDALALYELFTSSVIALISYFLVKDCNAIALNFRTFVSKPADEQRSTHPELDVSPSYLHWLTSVNTHWTSSGTLIVSTTTERHDGIRCVDDVLSTVEQKQLVGSCIRVAPSGILAKITSFDDPLDFLTEEVGHRQKKRARINSLEQSIAKWKSAVTRWLTWRGYNLPDLQKRGSWLRIRTSQSTSVTISSPLSTTFDRDILWPRTLCFFQASDSKELAMKDIGSDSTIGPPHSLQRWFETPESTGFRDPLDLAQDWAARKPERDRVLETQRKAKKAEEEATRRKEEQSGLLPSSPLNARSGTYGDLQAVSGVYPTPPDGIAPGTGISHSDTPSVSGAASNVILAPGGTTPAINLSAPQDYGHADSQQQQPQTSPEFPPTTENFNTSSGNDDLFGDMDEDGYEANDIDEADFDFFDAQGDEDVDMMDAPTLPESKTLLATDVQPEAPTAVPEPQVKEEMSDPFAALENALATASQPATEQGTNKVEDDDSELKDVAPISKHPHSGSGKDVDMHGHETATMPRNPTPPLSPTVIAKTLQPSPPNKSTSQKQQEQNFPLQHDICFDPLSFNRRMSLADAKYQGGRFSSLSHRDTKDEIRISPGPPQTKSLRDVPLLTKLRYAIGVASGARIPEITALARAVSDDSDSSSEASGVSEEESGDEHDALPTTFMGSLVLPAKRKLPTEGHGTPMSVTSFTESLAGDWHDFHGLHLDETSLTFFEPTTWDWSLVRSPSPVERPVSGSRFSMPALPALDAQIPDTPTSQPDLTWEPLDDKVMTGKDRISITQIVTDQVVPATLDILEEDASVEAKFGSTVAADIRWHTTIKGIFPGAVDCDLPALAAVHEVFPDLSAHAKGQPRPPPPRQPNDGPALTKSQMYPIHAPYLRVRRAETHWDLLPPAMAFWEPLGLSPISPSKNVVAFCIYPHSESLRPCLENFLLNVQLAYDSCKLGSHTRVETVVEFESGLVPWRVEANPTPREAFTSLRDVCVQLGKLLAIQHTKIREQQDSKIDAFVIYMIDPVGGSSGLWELCSSFWTLFQAYGQSVPGRPDQLRKPDLVLQVVPIKYIAAFDVPVMLDPSTYINLAREVYDRCPPSAPSEDKTSLGIYRAPAFQLEEGLPRSIPFKLISEPPQDLLREGSYLHVGYAISLDGTWLTAAWTDNCGKSQAVVSYHLGTRMFGEIAKEIWQTTIEIAQSRRVQWRICIAKAGAMETGELDIWTPILSCPTHITLFITLITVDTDPALRLTPTAATTNTTAHATTTPGSTPQPGVSPDTTAGLTPAATPSAESAADPSVDPEARLIDVTDETWGVILAHRVHNSNSTNQFNPAVVSGLLVKRGETFATSSSTAHPFPDPETGPIVVGVNILWIGAVGSTRVATSPFPPTGPDSAPPSPGPSQEGPKGATCLNWTPTPQSRVTAETLLKEALGQYRALGLLAKLRGMRGTRHGTVPWHVAAAMRGVKGLGKVMGGL
jgi:mediator of RNA polymerase II transcription subunit 13